MPSDAENTLLIQCAVWALISIPRTCAIIHELQTSFFWILACLYITWRNALCSLRHLGGLLVKMLASCTKGPGFDPWVENPKFSKDLHKKKSQLDVVRMKFWICSPWYQSLCWASKRSHAWGECVTCYGLLLFLITSSINPHEWQELALESYLFISTLSSSV